MLTRVIRPLYVLSICGLLSAACARPTPEPIVNTVEVTRVVEREEADTETVLVTATPIDTSEPTEEPTATPSPTSTPEPTGTPTLEPTPTVAASPTPLVELGPENVALPVGDDVDSFVYKKCYVNTETHFHAGDIIYYELGCSSNEFLVHAPIEGTVREIVHISDSVGWEMRIETDFVYDGKRVWYDLVHHDGPASGIATGSSVEKGEPIAVIKSTRDNGRPEKLLDMAIRNGPRGPNPRVSPFNPDSYLNVFEFLRDDLQLRNVTYEQCLGSPR